MIIMEKQIREALIGQRYPLSNMELLGFRLDESRYFAGEHYFLKENIEVYWNSDTNNLKIIKNRLLLRRAKNGKFMDEIK